MMEKLRNNKWLKIGLLAVTGLLLAGGLVFAGYWYSQMSDVKTQISKQQLKPQILTPTPAVENETVNWKIYTNTKYRYSIKYPPEFSYRVSEKGEAMIAFDPSQEVLESPAAEDKTLIIITADTSKPVIDKSYFGEPAQIAEETEVIIDGEIGQQVVFSEPVAWIQTAVAHGKRSFYFNLQNMQYRLEYNQILSTFRFLE